MEKKPENIPKKEDSIKFSAFLDLAQDLEKASPSYQFIFQLLFGKIIISKKDFYIYWIEYVLENYMNDRSLKDIEHNFTEKNTEELVALLVKNCNETSSELGLRICEYREELTGDGFITMISDQLQEKNQNSANPTNKQLLTGKFIKKIMESKDGYFDRFWAIEEARKLKNPWDALKVEQLLNQMQKTNFLVEDEGKFTFGIRALVELEPDLIKKFQGVKCLICKKIIIHRHLTESCPMCKGEMHGLCFKTLMEIGNESSFICPKRGCKAKFPKEEEA